MIVFLVRHARVENGGESLPEQDRQLSPRGLEQARYLGEQIMHLPSPPQLILTSADNASVETARVLHALLDSRLDVSEALETGRTAGDVIDLVQSLANPCPRAPIESLALVGDNPQLGEVIGILTRGVPGPECMLRTGEAVIIDADPGDLIGSGKMIGRIRLAETPVGAKRV